MRVTRHKRQIILFLVAILVPAGVLIGLAGRIMYQDRELAAKRAVDQRRAAVDQLRRELSSRLETIKLQEINRLIRSPNSSPARASRTRRSSLPRRWKMTIWSSRGRQPSRMRRSPRNSRSIAKWERPRNLSKRIMQLLRWPIALR